MSLYAQPGWKWAQYPDPNGDDVKFEHPFWVGDDWLCEETGTINTICLSVSFKNDIVRPINAVHLQIWSDQPANPPQNPYSQPLQLLWQYDGIPIIVCQEEGEQGFYDPLTLLYTRPDHVYYYCLQMDILDPDAFLQIQGNTYWLVISVDLDDPLFEAEIGWKTARDQDSWGDAAVFWNDIFWMPLPEPPLVNDNLAFCLFNELDDCPCPVELSSFSATSVSAEGVSLQWITQSETNLAGYNVLRNTANSASTAVLCNCGLIAGTNTSTQQAYTFEDTEIFPSSTYWYWLESVDMTGEVNLFGPVCVTVEPGQGDTPEPDVSATALMGNYPNPFSPNTVISYNLSKEMRTTLNVYNIKGQLVKTLVNSDMASGAHSVIWDGTNNLGQSVPTGIYFCNLITPEYRSIHKMILTK
jgi:hypothetical protein